MRAGFNGEEGGLVFSTLPVQKMLVCKFMRATSKEAERRGQANARRVEQGQSRDILKLGHSHRERYSRLHK